MLARRELPAHYREFNRKWGAPNGRRLMSVRRLMGRRESLLDRFVLEPFPQLRGPFGFQDNNTTREFDTPGPTMRPKSGAECEP